MELIKICPRLFICFLLLPPPYLSQKLMICILKWAILKYPLYYKCVDMIILEEIKTCAFFCILYPEILCMRCFKLLLKKSSRLFIID